MLTFVIGTGRCGSSLVHELLARHPDVGFLSNLDDRIPGLPSWARRSGNVLYRRLPPSLTRKGRLRYGPSEGYRALAREVSPMVTQSSRDLLAGDAEPWVAERFSAFFTRRSRTQGRPVLVHKYTGWPRSGFIREVFPDARFIHVVRDGRAFAASALRTPWWLGYMGPEAWQWGPLPAGYASEWEDAGRSFPVLAAISWKLLLDAFAEARALVPGEQWLDLRFEDLLADPRHHIKEMLAFIGLDEHPALDRALSRTVLEPERQQAYRRQLDPGSLALIERSLAKHLPAWGYETEAAENS